MNDWLITFRSVTFAQKGEKALKKAGIDSRMQRTPRMLSERGCGYCLRVRGAEVMPAVLLLREDEIDFEKTYALSERGEPEERKL